VVELIKTRVVAIGDVVQKILRADPSKMPGGDFTYVDLGSVDQDRKVIRSAKLVSRAEAPGRARQVLKTNDVLVSTVRPNLNGVARVPANLDGSIASTGFCVLRPKADLLDPLYLFHWVQSSLFVDDMVRKATGASYPAVSDKLVFSSHIPLPSLDEQRRIAAILDQAKELRNKRRCALEQLDSLTQSVFHAIFDRPMNSAENWPTVTLESVARQITDGEHQTPLRQSSGIKLLSARNVRNGRLDVGNVDYIDMPEYERISRRCKPQRDDVLISCSGSIGRVAVVNTDEKFSLVRSVALVRPDPEKLLSKFLEQQLLTPRLQRKMSQGANTSSQANLFQGPIRKLPIVLPPIELQGDFVDKASAVECLKDQHLAQVAELDALFVSLQYRAFKGEL
jgi:type I restriction enzyme S subunit